MKRYQPRIYSVNRLDIVLQQVRPDGTCDPEDDVPAQPVYLASEVHELLEEVVRLLVLGGCGPQAFPERTPWDGKALNEALALALCDGAPKRGPTGRFGRAPAAPL